MDQNPGISGYLTAFTLLAIVGILGRNPGGGVTLERNFRK
jgi:hypothetical protein